MKIVKGVENMSNLEALVIQDLKDMGIKVPKSKKDNDEGQNLISGHGVFGRFLGQLPNVSVENCGLVPAFLVNIASLIEKNITLEGIFRKSGSVSRLKDLRAKVDAGEDISDACVLDLCSLFKQFFRDLQEPLLTTRLQDSYLSCYELAPAQRTPAILLLCHLLPDHHLATLRFVADFLHRVAARSDENKMDAANISVCLAPNIFHERTNIKIMSVADGESAKSAVAAPTSIVELLIEQSEEIGVIDDDLEQRLVLMTTCFSDSVFEQSDLEITENREKKRSGSFQGLISNLSSSFTKWRNREKFNSSVVQCSSSAAPCPTPLCDDSNYVNLTPVVMRKRKAEDDPLPFSTGKKLAILRSMPQNAVLGSTPYMSNNRKGKMAADNSASALIMPAITPCYNASLIEDSSDVKSERYKPQGTGNNRVRRGNSMDSSPINSPQLPKNKVRKSFEGLIRRLSGGKDCQMGKDKADLLPQKFELDRDLVQRSPSTPSFAPLRESNVCLLPGRQSLHASFNCAPDVADWTSSDSSKRRQRSLSADGTSMMANTSLRRGRPNTTRSGLPSPLRRRPSDVEACSDNSVPFMESGQSATSLIDTSPIVPENSCSPVVYGGDRKECEMTRQISAGSFEETASSNLDQAFISSAFDTDTVLSADGVDLDETEYCQDTTLPVDSDDVMNSEKTSSSRDKHNSVFDLRRPRDPMERFVLISDRQSRLADQPFLSSAGSSSRAVPKIKQSLMSDTISKRLFVKTSSPVVTRTKTGPFNPPGGIRRQVEPRESDVNFDLK